MLRFAPLVRKSLHHGVLRFLEIATDGKRIFVWPIVFGVVSCAISVGVLNRTPFLQDSAAHLFQAKVFLAGHLTAPEPKPAEFFSLSGDMLVMQNGRWFSMYMPGFSLLLAGAMLFSLEWFLSPLLGAATIWIWIVYARRWYGARSAGLFALIAISSPFLLMMSSTIMVYTPELFFVSAVLFLSRYLMEKETVWGYLGLFVALCWVMIVRSFSSGIFLGPVLGYVAVACLMRRSYRVPLIIAAGIICGGAMLLYYQYRTTGDPFRSAYFLEFPKLELGFTDGVHSHTPLRGLANVSNNILGLNSWLTGWFPGSLFFIFIFLLFSRQIDRWDVLMVVGCYLVITFYFFHFFQDLIIGPRYYYVFAPFLLLIIARTAFLDIRSNLSSYVLCLIAFSILTALLFRLPSVVQHYQIDRTYPGSLRRELDGSQSQKILVFLDRTVRPYFVNFNDPFLRGNAIICLDRGLENPQVMKAFPSYRPVYFRSEITMERGKSMASGYRFFDTPNETPAGYVSMNQLALAIQNASGFVDQDFLHIVYSDVLNSDDTAQQLEFVSKRLRTTSSTGKKPYAVNFEKALLHTAKFLLIPKVEYDKNHEHWREAVDWKNVREELASAERNFLLSGEIGKPISPAFAQIKKTMDMDQDGSFSDSELGEFFQSRLSISN